MASPTSANNGSPSRLLNNLVTDRGGGSIKITSTVVAERAIGSSWNSSNRCICLLECTPANYITLWNCIRRSLEHWTRCAATRADASSIIYIYTTVTRNYISSPLPPPVTAVIVSRSLPLRVFEYHGNTRTDAWRRRRNRRPRKKREFERNEESWGGWKMERGSIGNESISWKEYFGRGGEYISFISP